MANSPARSIEVGSVIADTYTIEALIGRGGMGAVYLARHNRLPGKQVAIKLLHAELTGDEILVRFKREAEIASRLGHPNIVAVHDFNVTPDGTPYLVLEYLRGESLAQRLAGGPLGLEQMTSILRQVGSALAAAHRQGVIHRDLKPQNIFLVPTEIDGRIVEIAKVLDFGISKLRGSQTLQTQETTLLGTPQYMAPEQAKGEHASVDERTDVFALGAIVYEMLTGAPAFSGASIPEVVFKVVYEPPAPLAVRAPHVPATIVAAVERAMAKPKADRFATVSDLVLAITGQPVVQVQAVSIPPPEPGFAGGSRAGSVRPGPATHEDAFARTVGSGDHGAPALGDAVTVASGVEAPRAPEPAAPAPPPRRSRAGLAIALVALAAAGAAAVIMYLAMRAPDEPPAGGPPADAMAVAVIDAAVVVAVDAARPAPDAAIVAVAADAAAPADAAKVARPTRPTAPPRRPDGDGDGDDARDDSPSGRELRRARAALRARDYVAAERVANTLINTASEPRLVALAHGIRGAARCAAHHDREGARADLRAIPRRFARARRLLVAACRANDVRL